MRTTMPTLTLLLLASLFSGCAPEVGSEKWCEDMADQPKGDWTANEARDFAKYCVFKNYIDHDN